jgi:hypothetical protein
MDSLGTAVVGRRSFLRKMGIAGASLAPVTALLLKQGKALGKELRRGLTEGDVAILRFLAAAEILETDLWPIDVIGPTPVMTTRLIVR